MADKVSPAILKLGHEIKNVRFRIISVMKVCKIKKKKKCFQKRHYLKTRKDS